VYLNCEFVVTEGEFARRKMWSLIGLLSPKGPEWANMGRTFIKAILNSARGIHPGDNSPAAQNARRIAGFADLDGLEFLGKVDWEKDQNGQDKSVIKSAVTPDHKDYAALMGAAQSVIPAGQQPQRLRPGQRAGAGARSPQLGRVTEDSDHDAPSPSNPARRPHPRGAATSMAIHSQWHLPDRARRSCYRRSPAACSPNPMPRPASSPTEPN
jgi:hypothetical protein